MEEALGVSVNVRHQPGVAAALSLGQNSKAMPNPMGTRSSASTWPHIVGQPIFSAKMPGMKPKAFRYHHMVPLHAACAGGARRQPVPDA